MLLIEILTAVLMLSLGVAAFCIFELRKLKRDRAAGEAGFVPFPFLRDDDTWDSNAIYDSERECFTIGERVTGPYPQAAQNLAQMRAGTQAAGGMIGSLPGRAFERDYIEPAVSAWGAAAERDIARDTLGKGR